MSAQSVAQTLKETAKRLTDAGFEEAQLEARYLVAHAAGIRAPALLQSGAKEFPAQKLPVLEALLLERLTGRPLQYVLGEWSFMGLPFRTDERALIPRADTEALCEQALQLIRARGYQSALDMCCGTGCIGISLARLGGVRVTLADCDEAALSLARENATLNGVAADLIQTDLFQGISGRFELIACNPPYLSAWDMAHLQKELAFEPARALDGGADGLTFYRRIAREALSHILPGGALLLEVGAGQADAVASLFDPAAVCIVRDLNGVQRVVMVLL